MYGCVIVWKEVFWRFLFFDVVCDFCGIGVLFLLNIIFFIVLIV